MNVLNVLETNGFGLKVLVIGVIVAIAELLLKKFCKNRLFLVNYLPLIIAFIGEFIAELILNGSVAISEELLYGGVMTYSIGTLSAVWIKKLFTGEITKDELFLAVKSIIQSLCVENSSAQVSEIVELLHNSSEDYDSLKARIIALLAKIAKDGVSKAEIAAATEKILLSAKNVKEK